MMESLSDMTCRLRPCLTERIKNPLCVRLARDGLNEGIGKKHGEGAVLFLKTALDTQRLPWAFLFVLPDYKGVLAGVANDPHVLDGLSCSTNILDDQAEGSADCSVGDISRAQRP